MAKGQRWLGVLARMGMGLTLLSAVAACDDAEVSGGGGGAGGGPAMGGGQSLPPVTDYTRPGPFPVQVVNNTGPNRQYTMYRPRNLDQGGRRFSPMTWGNGILTVPAIYDGFLRTVASHGFVIIASNSAAVTAPLMRNGLEWLLAQNSAAGELQGKLDVNRAVSMGYSIGGTAAVQVGSHQSVATTISIHGHTTRPQLRGPLLQTTGTEDTVGVPLQQATFNQSNSVPTFLATLTGATHFEILGNGGREVGPIVAWLRFWIYGDEGARRFFYGNDCVLCRAPWENPQRKNWR